MTETEILITFMGFVILWLLTSSGSPDAPKKTAAKPPGERMIDDAELIRALLNQRQVEKPKPTAPAPTREDLLLKMLLAERGKDGNR